VTFDRNLRRRRLAVLLRVPLAVPPAAILLVWSVVTALTLVATWAAALALGRVPRSLHRFLRAYLEYALRVSAWLTLVSGGYPPLRFWRRNDVRVSATPARQARASVLFRVLFALPGVALGSAFAVVVAVAAVGAWSVALVRGRTTEGLRELGAFCLRYEAEALAFLLLLTARPPKLAPPSSAGER